MASNPIEGNRGQKFILSTFGHPLYLSGVEYAAQATMENCRPGDTSRTERFAGQTDAQFKVTGRAQQGSLSSIVFKTSALVPYVSIRYRD
jgi:hypothetical protein